MLQGVATMADMFAWQKWMHSVTYENTDAIIIKYTNRDIAISITCRPYREALQNIVLLPMFKFLSLPLKQTFIITEPFQSKLLHQEFLLYINLYMFMIWSQYAIHAFCDKHHKVSPS